MNTASDFLPWLLEATLRGSACMLVVWLLRPFFRGWLGARATHLLWLGVLGALLSPWLPRLPLPSLRPSIRAVAEARGFAKAHVSVSVQVASGVGSPAVYPVGPLTRSPFRVLFWIWAGGASAAAAVALLQTARAARLGRRAPAVGQKERVAAALAGLPHRPATLQIRETEELRSPALCGVFEPVILLPVGWETQLTDEELRCVLLHEIGHLQRGDLLWRWAFVIARAVHWFNPLVWLAARSARADQEMACDEWVCSRSSSYDAAFYGEVLLKSLQLSSPYRFAAPAHVAMAESKIGLTRRIEHLTQIRSHGWAAPATAVISSAVALLMVGPGPGSLRAQTGPPPAPENRTSAVAAAVATSPGGAAPRQVEIATAFVEISGSAAEVDAVLSEIFPKAPTANGLGVQAILNEAQHQELIQRLNSIKQIDMLAAPRVTTRVGQRATIEIIREFRYPTEFMAEQPVPTPKNFETRNTGVTVDCQVEQVSGDQLRLELVPQVVEFLGFVNYNGGRPARVGASGDALSTLLSEPLLSTDGVINQPIFAQRKMRTSIPIKSGQTALLFGIDSSVEVAVEEKGLTERLRLPKFDAPAADQTRKTLKRSLLVMVTPRIIDPTAAAPTVQPLPAPNPVSPSAAAPGELPLGKAVPGKEGFITSPYAPDAGSIDVRGFPAGAAVKCPYSGKMLRIP